MKTLRVNDGIMANRFVFVMYQVTPTTTQQISENAIVNNQNQVIIHIMGNDQTIIKDLERLELRLHQQSSSVSNQELKICPINDSQNWTELAPAIQMERIDSEDSQEYVIDLLPYIEKNEYDHYFLIEKVQAEVGDIQLYVRTNDTNCARVNFLFKEIKSTKVKSKYYNQIACDHQINTNISDGIVSIHKPLVAFKGKKLSCQLSINYKPINEQFENKMASFLPQGWSFNYQQYVGKIEDSDNYYYVNDKRQIIVFKKVNNNTYIEESGSGMLLKERTTSCIITDLNQTEYHFEYGYLTKITNGNTSIHIQYEIYSGKRIIVGITDSSNRELYFTYEPGKITINSMFCNELSIIIQNNKLVEIREPDNTNVITNDIYYGYANGLLSRIERRKEKAKLSYYPNGNIQKIISYRNNSKENTTEFTYKSTYTLVEYYKDEKIAEELIKEKYYFNEEKEYTRSVEVVGEKELEIEAIKEDEIYFETGQDRYYFISTLLEGKGQYNYQDPMHSYVEDIVLDNTYKLTSVTKSQELFLNIQTYARKRFFITGGGPREKTDDKYYCVDYKIEVCNSKTGNYEVLISKQNLFKSNYNSIQENNQLPYLDSKVYMQKLELKLTNAQKELLLNSNLIKITFTSNMIMTLEEPTIILTSKTSHSPLYYTNVKIVDSFLRDDVYFSNYDYPYSTFFMSGYGMLEYPNVIKYNQNNGPEVTLSSNVEITYKDMLMNKKNYYMNKNIFYYNNLKDAISNFNYDTLEIGNVGGTYKFTHLQLCQVIYQKQTDGSFSRIYIACDYEEREDQIVMVQDQVQIFGEIEDNIDKKEEIKIYDLEGKLLEEISTYNYLYVLYNSISPYTQMQHEGFTNTKKEYTYDEYGNLTKERVGTIPVIDEIDDTKDNRYYLEIDEEGELYTVHYTYDENNNNCIQKTVTKGEDIITDYTYTYDNLGNLLSITDETSPQQNKTEYSYSPYFKELVEVKQGNAKKVLTYRNNKLTKVTDTYGMYYNYQYNQKEDLSQINYQTAMISYPLENYTEIKPLPNNTLNITKGQTGYIVEYNNTNRVGYAYDKYGNLIKQYEYRLASDQMEVTSVAIYGEEKLNDGTSIYEINDLSDERIIKYGNSNLRIHIDYFANTKTIFKYNDDNECIESITYDLTTNAIKNKVTKEINNNILSSFTIKDLQKTIYTYNKNGRMNQENIYTKTNKNINVNYTYDNYQRIKNINYTYYVNPSNVYNSEEYTYEENKIKTYKNSYSNTTYELTYDNQDRIVEVKENNKQPKTYTYNELGYLIKEKDENQETIYTYDNEANITTKKTYNLNNELINDIIYTYGEDDKNKLITVTQNNQTTNITYDDVFNVKSYSGMTFEYARGRLVSKVNKNNQSYTYTYNNNDQRIKKETPNTTTEYTYLNNKLIKEQVFVGEESSYEIDYIYTLNKLIGFEYNGNDYFYEYDILGNIIGIYNNNTLKARYTYDAYGNHKVYNSNNQIDNNTNFIGNINKIRYKGYYYDVETQLYWVSSRYYNPEWGRFIQSDTLDYLDPQSINGLNLYCYCFNDPINNYDPTGHFTLPNWAKWVIGGVAFVGAVALTYLTGGALAPVFMGMAGSILLDGVVEGAISSANGGSFWEGFANGAANGAMWGGIFALGGATLRTIKMFKNGVAIGENMKRVNNLAKAGHQITYKGMPGFKFVKMFGGDDLARTLSMRHNQAFIERMMKWGVKIVDFGIDTSRNYRSFYYLMETIVSNGYGLLQLMY